MTITETIKFLQGFQEHLKLENKQVKSQSVLTSRLKFVEALDVILSVVRMPLYDALEFGQNLREFFFEQNKQEESQ
jgi:hypothetical protein